jgi:membrane-bound serine protease (ClpP class)
MNKLLLFIFFVVAPIGFGDSQTVPVISLADTINPGSADYIISEITKANQNEAPYVVLQLDTPGGLLQSTRQVIQSILNSKIPVVIWVGPKGAQAASAGALITLAGDVTAMAPGTNIGAAHPIDGSGRSMDKTLADKITNDTAALAESLAKSKGRNSEWAKQSVTLSLSLSADEAVKQKVVDFIATDITELEVKLRGFSLKSSKDSVTNLENRPQIFTQIKPGLKHRVVSFFSNPSLAYLILSLGALCLWIELSHPGLVFPGVLGGVCVILSLVSFQFLPIRFGALGLIFLGLIFFVAELYVSTHGALGLGGVLAFILGSLYLMDTDVPEFQISTFLIFPVALSLALVLTVLTYFLWKTRRLQSKDSFQRLIGLSTEANTDISEHSGNIFLLGELWSARSSPGIKIPKGAKVTVKAVTGLIVWVETKEKAPC